MSDPLERIAFELECIRELMERFMVVPSLPTPPEKLLGKEAITYFDEASAIAEEEEELRQISRGLIPTLSDD